MRSDIPRVSVGLPVYNGENFVEQAIDSILRQTFVDFELIISDNASTDATETICRTFAERDRRIRYYRNPKNIGGMPNFNRLVSLARGNYFKWAAHDDLCAPEFLEECVAVLDREPTVVLCHSLTQTIDQHGRVVDQDGPRSRIDSVNPRERFLDIVMPLTLGSVWFFQFGVIRIQALRNSSLQGAYPSADRILLAELALAGRFHQIPKLLFFERRHPDQYSNAVRSRLEGRAAAERLKRLLEWHNPGAKHAVAFPECRIVAESARAVLRSNLSWSDRIDCWIALARRSWWFRSKLVADLEIGFYALGQRLVRSVEPAQLHGFPRPTSARQRQTAWARNRTLTPGDPPKGF
jgi:glycosyltransferase involved in cell wall biosynthesis